MSFVRAAPVIALTLLPVASCRDATQITVDVTTDVKCPDVKGTSLTIGTLDGLDGRPPTAQTTACTPGAVARVGKIVVVPSGEKDDAVAVRVVLGFGRDPAECVAPTFGPGCIVARRSLRYVPHENLTLPIFMSAACSGVACGATETCVGGTCKPATIDDPSLCTKAEGCGEEALGSVAVDGGAPVDAEPPPCAAGTVCDVVSASDIVDVAVAAGALFWLDLSGNVSRAAADGTGARVIVRSEQVPVAGLEADAANVYWTARGQLRRAGARDGASPSDVAPAAAGCLRWMQTGKSMFVGEPGANGVRVVDVTSGARVQAISNADAPWGVGGTSPRDVYYTNFNRGLIRHADGDRGVTDTIATAQRNPRCLALDSASLWWANSGDGSIMTATTLGQGVKPVATGQTGAWGIAIDSTHVYWSWQGGIRKTAR
jgi:hypothetical protein